MIAPMQSSSLPKHPPGLTTQHYYSFDSWGRLSQESTINFWGEIPEIDTHGYFAQYVHSIALRDKPNKNEVWPLEYTYREDYNEPPFSASNTNHTSLCECVSGITGRSKIPWMHAGTGEEQTEGTISLLPIEQLPWLMQINLTRLLCCRKKKSQTKSSPAETWCLHNTRSPG